MTSFVVRVRSLDGNSGDDMTVNAPDEATATRTVLSRFKVKTKTALEQKHQLTILEVAPAD